MSNGKKLVAIVPFPATTKDLFEQRRGDLVKSITDRIEDQFRKLALSEEFIKYIRSATNDEAIEGKVDFDRFRAADMIRKAAEKDNDHAILNLNQKQLINKLGVVLRRYEIGITQRVKPLKGGDA